MYEDIYFIVVYQSVPNRKNTIDRRSLIIKNEIIHGVHPLVWLARPTEQYDEYYTSYLLFFAEIPEAVAKNPDVISYFGSVGSVGVRMVE